jgi:hypothetical protein
MKIITQLPIEKSSVKILRELGKVFFDSGILESRTRKLPRYQRC